jgi:broad specificity phosphatase PhoE
LAEIVLIRHGQASLGADDYDQLSEIGSAQAKRLGEHWRDLAKPFDHIVMGSMLRHAQTTEAFLQGYLGAGHIDLKQQDVSIQSGLNEYNHTFLLAELKRHFPDQWIDTNHRQRDYYHNIRKALAYWSEGKIATDGSDTWSSFQERILAALQASIEEPFKRVLLVTSGGPISNLLAHFLKMPAAGMIDVSLRIKNTSVNTIVTNRIDFTVETINDVSHLNNSQYQHLITLV